MRLFMIKNTSISSSSMICGSMHNQRGAVLLVAMVMMLVMAMVGITAMRSTTLEERMSANMRDRAVALQAAEVALNRAESYLEAMLDASDFVDGAPGLYEINTEIWKTLDWKGAGVRVVDSDLDETALDPRYIIEMGRTVAVSGNTQADFAMDRQSGVMSTSSEVTFFTITAVGFGSSETAQVRLQAYYGKRL